MKRLALLPLVMLVFACNGSSDALLEPPGPSFSSGPGPVIASATGGGIRFREDPFSDRTLAFTANKHADESVQGQVELVLRKKGGFSSEFKASGKVICLSVDGNRAWIGGYFTHGRWVDQLFVFYAEDNGEGANADPDVLSGLFNGWLPEDLEWWCGTRPDPDHPDNWWFGNFEIDAGNIQVDG